MSHGVIVMLSRRRSIPARSARLRSQQSGGSAGDASLSRMPTSGIRSKMDRRGAFNADHKILHGEGVRGRATAM
jgi:hypothetical protein